MKRNLIEGQAIDNVDEILGYDRELRMYYYWMVRPQIKIVLEIIRKIYKRRKENLSILDIGCGTARVPIGVVERERERVSKIYAIDISQNMLEMAAKNAKEAGVEEKIVFLRTEGKKLDFESNFFDIVMCSNMLHHLKDPVELLKEMKRVVKKEGCIAIRDVIRPPSKFILNLYVEVFGLPYSKLMKKGYRKSLYSAFSIKELKYMLTRSGITGVKMFKSFPHFVTFIKEAK